MRFKAVVLQRLLRIDELRQAHATSHPPVRRCNRKTLTGCRGQVKHMVRPPRDDVPSGPTEPDRRPAALPHALRTTITKYVAETARMGRCR